ncbi:hypothetical protein LOC67_25985 [Stieleria sp. JC731]|uniref:DUF4175 family protein n=1 Tax=Pirellulaceae TaxID=2691357 RepID=UPI001E3DF1E8|nr:DUF4175 family protein [Stieleria sp. JC731]MCC9604018.1 hypothetical protein [Stieleria sp. JC731]
MNAPDVAYQVARQFAALRRRYLGVRVAALFGYTSAALLAFVIALSLVDYRWEIDADNRRTALLSGTLSIFAVMFWRLFAIVKESRQRSFAGRLERSFDDFGQRIRTVLDTVDGRVSGPMEMLRALGNQTLGRWDLAMPNRIIPTGLMYGGILVLMLTSGIMAGMFSLGGDIRLALLRVLGSETPYTMLESAPGDTKLLEGTPVEVSLQLVGRTDRDVLLRYRELALPGQSDDTNDIGSEPIEWIESKLLPDEPQPDGFASARRKQFSLALGNARVPIEYQFISAGQQTKIHRIDIQPLIEVQSLTIEVTPPEYTELPARVFDRPDLTVLEQSEVVVTILLNHPLSSPELLVGVKKPQLQKVELVPGEDRSVWSFTLPSTETIRWQFSGAGRDGTPMDPVFGKLSIRRDAAPTVRWNEPSDELQVHTLAEIPLSVQVSDDYGIVESGIAFQIGGDEEYVLLDWIAEEDEEDESVNVRTRLKLSEILPLETFQLTQRDYVAYYAYAIDNRPWGPHRTESDVRYIDIRPLRQFYQQLEPMPNDGQGNGLIVQLSEIIRRQRFMINRVRKLVRDGASLASQLGTIDRLVKNQSELADLTRFLAEFFISRGNDDVEALSQAESSMLQAADSLAAGTFDLAYAQQQDALRSLVEARQAVEQILRSNMTSQQRQQLRRLASQLRQKLRLDRPQTERQLVDSLRRIASDQRQLASMAAKMNGGQQFNQSMSGTQGGATPKDDSKPNGQGSIDSEEPEQTPESDETAESPEPTEDSQNEQETPGDNSEESAGENEVPPNEALYEQQVELMERLEAIRDELQERLESSELMSSRMDAAASQMDSLADQAQQDEPQKFAQGGQETGDLLEEMSVQLEALSASEPVARISSLRDLTVGMGIMEQSLADELSQTPGQSPASKEPPKDIEPAKRRIQSRVETLKEVISGQAEIGDIEMSEVNDRLQTFADENEFLDLLASSKEAVENIDKIEATESMSARDGGLERSRDYIDAARQLERLYQQLVTPRLARLRQMEGKASSLSEQLSGNGGASEQSPETQAELQELAEDLRGESLRELAELLENEGQGSGTSEEETEGQGGGSNEDDYDEQPKGGGGEQEKADDEEGNNNGNTNPDTGIRYLLDRRGGGGIALQNDVSSRLRTISKELRDRIQQVILLEIAVDRDTPIPSEYRRAVDGYFRTLSSDSADKDGMQSMTSSGKPLPQQGGTE